MKRTLMLLTAILASCTSEISLPGAYNIGTCSGKRYDITQYKCVKGELAGTCNGENYYPPYQRCFDGVIESFYVGDEAVEYEDETYETAIVEGQTWLMRNLNVMHSEGNGNSWCYNDDPANCAKYGRLYDWAAAMDLPSDCNTSSCAHLIGQPHRGLCPENFHVPTWEEYQISYGGVIKFMEEVTGWDYSSDAFDNSSAQIDFSNLLSGNRNLDGSFANAGMGGAWWGAAENPQDETRGIGESRWFIATSYKQPVYYKSNGFAVLCLKD